MLLQRICVLSLFSGKSNREGVLITHKSFKFTKNNATTNHSGIPAHSRAAMAELPGPSLRGMS